MRHQTLLVAGYDSGPKINNMFIPHVN